MTTLDPTDLERVSDAIRRAEARTAGDIVVVVDRAAGSYRSLTLVLAWVLALFLPWPFLWGTQLSAQHVFLAQLALALLLALMLAFRQDWRLALTPRFMKRQRAHEVACREFIAREVTRTASRGGVLIYVALAERYAEILADTAAQDKIGQEGWKPVVAALTEALADQRLAEGLIAAVEQAGDLLSAALPATGPADQLPNRVILL